MRPRERVALVTPRLERRRSAANWAPLLSDRAEILLCASPREESAVGADLLVVDENCPDLDEWIEQASTLGREPDSIVVFGDARESERGAISWGSEGSDVLATISDLLDRKLLLAETDAFLKELRDSNERLDMQRRRFSRLVLQQAELLRGANANLSREVEELSRLQAVARFFAAPGPDDSFADRLANVVGRALGTTGAAIARRRGSRWGLDGAWKISKRNATAALPESSESPPERSQRSSRRDHDTWWLPVGPDAGVVLLARAGQPLGGDLGREFVGSVCSLVADGIAARAAREALLSRNVQSERILQTLKGGLLRIDAGRKIVLANLACAQMLHTTGSELEGRALDDVFARDERFREILAPIFDTETAIDDVETAVTTADGRRIMVSVRASRLPAASGGPGGVLVLLSDLSRRKVVEEEVRRADRLIALGRLSAGVAHEIRNPLAGIRTTAEILRGRVASEEGLTRFVDVILEEASRLDRIVGSLLQFAKPPEPRLEPLAVREILERARDLAAGRAAERGIAIRVSAPEPGARPFADREQILQVLLNLILNAIEATPESGEVRLSAELERVPGGGHLGIVVEDDGRGVAPGLTGRIFDPFFTTKPGGTGLGLSISQNILTQHGGRIRIERGRSGGARAIVLLPLGDRSRDGFRTGEGKWPTS